MDGHSGMLVGSPIATHSPHTLQSHQQPAISSSSTSINSPNGPSSSTAVGGATAAGAIPTRPSLSSKSSSSPPRSSTEVDLAGKPSPSTTARWRNSLPTGAQHRGETSTPSGPQSGASTNVVEPTFDENVLRALCDLDVSRPVLLGSNVSTPCSSSIPLPIAVWGAFVA
jgi:hypothetical protein